MADTVHVRKTHAGSDSAGHTWDHDGAVIQVPADHALVLTRIPDGGFTIVEIAPAEQPGEPESAADLIETAADPVPGDPAADTKPPKPSTGRGSRAKTADPAPTD